MARASQPLRLSDACNGDVPLRDAGNRVLFSQAEFESELLGSIFWGSKPVPHVDFARSVVVVTHLGKRTSCGSFIAISNVRETDTEVLVQVERSTADGCPGDNSTAYPVAFAEIPRSHKPYRFENRDVARCATSAAR